MRDGEPAGQALDGVDVQSLVGHDPGSRLDLRGGQAATKDREDVALPPLASGPVLVLVVRDRLEADLDAQFRGLEKEFLHHLSGMLLVHPDQEAEGQGGVDVGLADVQDLGVIPGQDAGERGGESDPVFAGDADKDLLETHYLAELTGASMKWR